MYCVPDGSNFQTSLAFRQHRPTFSQLTRDSAYEELRRLRRASAWRPDGRCTRGVKRQFVSVMGWLGWEPSGKSFSVSRAEIITEAANRKIRAVCRLGVVCIMILVVLPLEVYVIRRGTGL